MKFCIRNDPEEFPLQMAQLGLSVEIDGLFEGISGFQIFLAIQGRSFYKCISIGGTGEEDEIGREHFVCGGSDDVAHLDLAPVGFDEFSISEYLRNSFVVGLFVRDIALVVFIAFIMVLTIPSRAIDMPITMMRGAHATNGFNGLIAGIVCKMAITKKYMLAILLN